jgi:sialidase-1
MLWSSLLLFAALDLFEAGQQGYSTYRIPGRGRREVHLIYCINYARAYYRFSRDSGLTFSPPVGITAAFETLRPQYDWEVIATGPGHGIRLRSGRLLVPIWLSTGGRSHRPSVTASSPPSTVTATAAAGAPAISSNTRTSAIPASPWPSSFPAAASN